MSQSLSYVLQENLLTSDPDDYTARPANAKSYSQDAIIDLVAAESTTVSKTDLLAVLNSYTEHIKSIVASGCMVNTPLFTTSFSISGVFKGADDSFDSARHALRLNIQPGSALREAVTSVTLEKARGTETTPWIQSVQDRLSDDAAANFEITAGSMIQLKGARVKYDDTDSEQGVFLIGTKTSEAVRMGKAVLNKPAMVIVQVPADLSAGEYELEVRTKVDGKHIYKTVKKGRFQRTIYVIA